MSGAAGSEIRAVGHTLFPSRKGPFRRRSKSIYAPIVLPFDNAYRFLVQSESDAASYYLVDLEEACCDCDHHRIRKPRTCKHLDWVMASR